MKNTIALFVCALAVLTAISCGDQSSGSSSSDFKIQPGDVAKFDTTISGTSFDVTFGMNNYNPTTHDDYHYAIIISNVNNTNNVGIAFGYDPKSNRSFKVFIYFPSSLFPPSPDTYSGTVTVIEDGVKYTNTSASIKIDSISGPTDTDNVYTIEITINNNIGGKPLTITSLTAYLVQ